LFAEILLYRIGAVNGRHALVSSPTVVTIPGLE